MAEVLTMQSIRSEVVAAVEKLKNCAGEEWTAADRNEFAGEADEILTALLGPIMLHMQNRETLLGAIGEELDKSRQAGERGVKAYGLLSERLVRQRQEAKASGPTDPPLWAIQEAREIVSMAGRPDVRASGHVHDSAIAQRVVRTARELVNLTGGPISADFEHPDPPPAGTPEIPEDVEPA